MHPLWNPLTERAGQPLTESQAALLERYLELLFAANARMNLTGIADPEAARLHHIADTMTLLPFIAAQPLPVAGRLRLADIGSGGGVPGIPLAILRPDIEVVLIESTQKKAAFLQETAHKLQLNNVRVIAQRVEDVGRAELRQTFDLAVARAVAAMIFLAEWGLPLLKTGGNLLAMKGPKSAGELPLAPQALRLLGGSAALVHSPGLAEFPGHVIIQIPKIGPSDPRFPRAPTHAKGKPLQKL